MRDSKTTATGSKGAGKGGDLAILSDIFYILICTRIFRLPAKKDYANTKQSRRQRRQAKGADRQTDRVRERKIDRERGSLRNRQSDVCTYRIFGFLHMPI